MAYDIITNAAVPRKSHDACVCQPEGSWKFFGDLNMDAIDYCLMKNAPDNVYVLR